MIRTSLFALLMLTTTLFADYITVYQMDDEQQTFMYKDAAHSKMVTQHESDKSSIYKIGKKTYIVNEENGKKTLMDVDEMKAMMGSYGGNKEAIKQDIKEKKESFDIDKTGRTQTVGGVRGEIWIVRGEEDGKKFKQEVVVSKNREIGTSMHAMFSMIATMSDENVDDTMNFLEIAKGYVVIKADGIRLVSFKEKNIPKSEYELPKDAKKQKMPNIGALFGGGDSKGNSIIDKCYTEVCCGSVAGASKVLGKMLENSSGGYKLKGSGVCNALGIASVFGVTSIEGALYNKGDDNIQVTLNLNDDSEGTVLKTKKQVQSTSYPVESVKYYTSGKMGGHTYYYGYFLPMKQETLDVIINDTTILSISRKSKSGRIDLINWTEDAIDFSAFKYDADTQDTNSNSENSDDSDDSDDSDGESQSDNVNREVDQAVDMFKSLF